MKKWNALFPRGRDQPLARYPADTSERDFDGHTSAGKPPGASSASIAFEQPFAGATLARPCAIWGCPLGGVADDTQNASVNSPTMGRNAKPNTLDAAFGPEAGTTQSFDALRVRGVSSIMARGLTGKL